MGKTPTYNQIKQNHSRPPVQILLTLQIRVTYNLRTHFCCILKLLKQKKRCDAIGTTKIVRSDIPIQVFYFFAHFPQTSFVSRLQMKQNEVSAKRNQTASKVKHCNNPTRHRGSILGQVRCLITAVKEILLFRRNVFN